MFIAYWNNIFYENRKYKQEENKYANSDCRSR